MADLGRKHVCFKCTAKFYDRKKPKALCPKCGADQADAPVVVAAPPPPPKRGPRPVDPVEPSDEEPVAEAAAEDGEDAELDVDADEDAAAADEDIAPTGEDSYD